MQRVRILALDIKLIIIILSVVVDVVIKVSNFDLCFDTKHVSNNKFVWRLFNTNDLKNPIRTAVSPLPIDSLVFDLEVALHVAMVEQGYTGKPVKLFK